VLSVFLCSRAGIPLEYEASDHGHRIIAANGARNALCWLRATRYVELSSQRNETETKQFHNCFKTVLKLVSVSFRCADSLTAVIAMELSYSLSNTDIRRSLNKST